MLSRLETPATAPVNGRRATLAAPRRVVFRALELAAVGYGALVVSYLVLFAVTGDALWPVAMLAELACWWLFPCFVLLPVALVLRRRLLALSGAIGAAAFLIWFGGSLWPHRAVPPDGGRVLRVLAFNVLGGGRETGPSPGDLVAILRASGADLVGLTELGPGQASALRRDLLAFYPHQVLFGEVGYGGKGLLSRYPIVRHERIRSSPLTHLQATVDVEGREVLVIVCHVFRPSFTRRGYRAHSSVPADIADLIRRTSAGPAILIGDFNLTDRSRHYQALRNAGLVDAYREAGWGFGMTWPNASRAGVGRLVPPLVRIDYVWHTNHWRTMAARVGPRTSSDHLPVIAELVAGRAP